MVQVTLREGVQYQQNTKRIYLIRVLQAGVLYRSHWEENEVDAKYGNENNHLRG